MQDPMRLRTLEALDRVDNFSSREAGLSDLRRIIFDIVDDASCRTFLGMLFTPRNKRIIPKLVPLLVDLAKVVSTAILAPEAQKCLLSILNDPNHHDLAGNTWIELFKAGVFARTSCIVLLMSSITDYQRKGLSLILVATISLILECGIDTRPMAEHLLELYRKGDYSIMLNELFISASLLIPKHVDSYNTIVEDILADCHDVLHAKLGKGKLSRPLALSCTLLLQVIGTCYPDSPEVIRNASSILKGLSRDNLKVFALTRCNPKLREAIRDACVVWQHFAPQPSKTWFVSSKPPSRPATAAIDRIVDFTRTSPHLSPVKFRTSELHDNQIDGCSCELSESSVLPQSHDHIDDDVLQKSEISGLRLETNRETSTEPNIIEDSGPTAHIPIVEGELLEILELGNERQLVTFLRAEAEFAAATWDNLAGVDAQFLAHVISELLCVDDVQEADIDTLLGWMTTIPVESIPRDNSKLTEVLVRMGRGPLAAKAHTVLNRLACY